MFVSEVPALFRVVIAIPLHPLWAAAFRERGVHLGVVRLLPEHVGRGRLQLGGWSDGYILVRYDEPWLAGEPSHPAEIRVGESGMGLLCCGHEHST